MTTKKPLTLPCPQCQTTIEWSEEFPFRPFCSKRCKMMDFGDWAGEKHKIAGDPVIDDVFSDDFFETQEDEF